MTRHYVITRESLHEMINTGDEKAMHRIGKALVHLFNRQTKNEKRVRGADRHNDRGFTSADSFPGTVTAQYYIKHGRLEPWQIDKWTRVNKTGVSRLAKYWIQINQISRLIKNDQPLRFIETPAGRIPVMEAEEI